jgi:hypothetical protein
MGSSKTGLENENVHNGFTIHILPTVNYVIYINLASPFVCEFLSTLFRLRASPHARGLHLPH